MHVIKHGHQRGHCFFFAPNGLDFVGVVMPLRLSCTIAPIHRPTCPVENTSHRRAAVEPIISTLLTLVCFIVTSALVLIHSLWRVSGLQGVPSVSKACWWMHCCGAVSSQGNLQQLTARLKSCLLRGTRHTFLDVAVPQINIYINNHLLKIGRSRLFNRLAGENTKASIPPACLCMWGAVPTTPEHCWRYLSFENGL